MAQDQRSTRAAMRRGFVDGLPFLAVIVPFSLLFGVVARDAGLDVLQVFAMSAIVIAGAAQFTALGLMQEGAPVLVVVLAALVVNLRMAMYSAAMVPHVGTAPRWQKMILAYAMVDVAFASAVAEYDRRPAMGVAEKMAYYFGNVLSICPVWYGCTVIGAILGRAIPASLSPDFAVPVCFIALLAPMLRSVPHWVAAGVSVAGALAFSFVPWNLGLLLAAALAMTAGAQTEFALARRAARE
jgi:4-azaleucine resistance transporter AzlC